MGADREGCACPPSRQRARASKSARLRSASADADATTALRLCGVAPSRNRETLSSGSRLSLRSRKRRGIERVNRPTGKVSLGPSAPAAAIESRRPPDESHTTDSRKLYFSHTGPAGPDWPPFDNLA